MAEIGKVIGTEKNKLVVRMTRKEACAKCAFESCQPL